MMSKIHDRWKIATGRSIGLDAAVVETSGACTNRCYMCPGRASKGVRKYMSASVFTKFLDQLAQMDFAGELYLFGQNEPLLDKRIFDRVREAAERLPKAKLLFITNFTYCTPEMTEELISLPLSRLTTSLYALTAKDYEAICGKDNFDRVIPNLVRFAKKWNDNRPYLFTVNLIKSPYNSHDKEFIDYFLNTIPCSGTARFPVLRQRGVIQKKFAKWVFTKCLYNTVKVTDNGKMTLCSFDADAEMYIGHINDVSIDSAYDSEQARKIRKSIFYKCGGKKYKNFCPVCDYADEHKILYFLLPFGESFRKKLYKKIGFNKDHFEQWGKLFKHWNSPQEIIKRSEHFERIFPNNGEDRVAQLEAFRRSFFAE